MNGREGLAAFSPLEAGAAPGAAFGSRRADDGFRGQIKGIDGVFFAASPRRPSPGTGAFPGVAVGSFPRGRAARLAGTDVLAHSGCVGRLRELLGIHLLLTRGAF